MKQQLLTIGLCLSLATAWAVDDNLPAAQIESIDLPVTPPIVGINVSPAGNVDAPDQNKADHGLTPSVTQKIDLFRSAVRNTEMEKNLFARLLTPPKNPVDAELLSEMRRHAEGYPEFPENAELYWLMSLVHQRIKDYPAEAIDLLQLRAAYQNSPFDQAATKRLLALTGDELKKNANNLKSINAKIDELKGARAERVAALLQWLGDNLEEDFARPIADACASFLASRQSLVKEDHVEFSWARQSAMLDAQTGIYHYDKLLVLYPHSALRAGSLLEKAAIQRKPLRFFVQAAATYRQLIAQFPESGEAKQGYEALGTMYDEDMRDYPNAIQTYEAIVARYGNDTVVLRALRAMALVQKNKINQPGLAIESYLKIADLFNGQDAMDALQAAEAIALYPMKDWLKAMEINRRIITLAPGYEDAIKAQFKNAEITEEKLADKEGAKNMYVEFRAQHPDHQLSKDAERRIKAIEKSLQRKTR